MSSIESKLSYLINFVDSISSKSELDGNSYSEGAESSQADASPLALLGPWNGVAMLFQELKAATTILARASTVGKDSLRLPTGNRWQNI